jgi:hypothetical protein
LKRELRLLKKEQKILNKACQLVSNLRIRSKRCALLEN